MLNAKAKKEQLKAELSGLLNDINSLYIRLKTLMNYDEKFEVNYEEIKILVPEVFDFSQTLKSEIFKLENQYNNTSLNLERNLLLPDLTIGYYGGTNKYDNSRYYNGFMIGVDIPLFYGSHKSKIDSKRINIQINESYNDQSILQIDSRYNEYLQELEKHKVKLEYYENTGKELGNEIIESALYSYNQGEIGFFQFVSSLENAIRLEEEYLNAVYNYNTIVLEMNYLTK